MENIGENFYQLSKIRYNGNPISRGDQILIYRLSSHMLHQAYDRVRENRAGDGNRLQSVVTDGSQNITTILLRADHDIKGCVEHRLKEGFNYM